MVPLIEWFSFVDEKLFLRKSRAGVIRQYYMDHVREENKISVCGIHV